MFGLAMVGVVLVPVNNRYLPDELGYVFGHARVSGVITTSDADKDFLASATDLAPGGAWIMDLATERVPAPPMRMWIILRPPTPQRRPSRDVPQFAARIWR